MNVLGLRASPKEVTFCVYDTDEAEVINLEEIRIPNALETPEKLKYLRATILDVLREYKIVTAGIRLTEPTAQSLSIERIQIEGVLQEAFASSTLRTYYQGPLATIASKLKVNKTWLSKLIKDEDKYEKVSDWITYSDKQREAILAALGAEYV